MASTGACFFPGASSPSLRPVGRLKSNLMRNTKTQLAASVSVEPARSTPSEKREETEGMKSRKAVALGANEWDDVEEDKRGWKAFFEESTVLIQSDGGPPRWFSPLDGGGSHSDTAPLLLYLPGIDGVGLGLIASHKKIGRIFDIWCLHIPVMDRTSFTGRPLSLRLVRALYAYTELSYIHQP